MFVKDAVKKFAYERGRLTPRHTRGIAELNGKRQQQIGKDDDRQNDREHLHHPFRERIQPLFSGCQTRKTTTTHSAPKKSMYGIFVLPSILRK